MRPLVFALAIALVGALRAQESAPPEDAAGVDQEKAEAAEGADSAASAIDFSKCAGDDCPETVVDRIFYVYGTLCSGMNWRFLHAVAQAESGLDPKNKTGKYVGLFQLDKDGCSENLTPFNKVLDCSDLSDAEANTAAAANRFNRYFTGHSNLGSKSNFPSIVDTCPGNSAKDNIALAYMGHNNGPAVLKHVLKKKACSADEIKAAITSFYEDNPKSRDDGKYEKKDGTLADCAQEARDKWGLVGTKAFRCVNAKYGITKYEYGVKKVAGVGGVDALYVAAKEKTTACPAVSGKRLMTEVQLAKALSDKSFKEKKKEDYARDKEETEAAQLRSSSALGKAQAAAAGMAAEGAVRASAAAVEGGIAPREPKKPGSSEPDPGALTPKGFKLRPKTEPPPP